MALAAASMQGCACASQIWCTPAAASECSCIQMPYWTLPLEPAGTHNRFTTQLNGAYPLACILPERYGGTRMRKGHTLQAELMLGSSGKVRGRLTMLSKVCSLRAPRKGDRPYTSSCRRMPKDHQSTGAPEKQGRDLEYLGSMLPTGALPQCAWQLPNPGRQLGEWPEVQQAGL